MPSFFIHGFHAVTGRLRQTPQSVVEIYLDADRQDPRALELRKQANSYDVKVIDVARSRLDGMAPPARHQGVVAKVRGDADKALSLDALLEPLKGDALLVVLDGVTDPHNLGAVLRVADAAGAQGVVVPKDRAVGLNATVRKVASGAAETVPLVSVTNLARALSEIKEYGLIVIGASEAASNSVYDVDIPRRVAWVFGAEGEGMRRLTRERCDVLARLPMYGSVDSLNVSVATAVCLYETTRRHAKR